MADITDSKPPKISVVLPTYNGERWLAESIQSVVDQTEKDWELIIVNDASTDGTLKIAEEFAERDKRIHVITNEQNKKLPASLNIGFAKSRGKYRTWTSDDNMFHPNALARMSTHLESHQETDLVAMNMEMVDSEGGIVIKDIGSYSLYRRNTAFLLHDNNVGAAFMYRKSIADRIGGYDEDTFCAEDYDYWCRIALAGKIEYFDAPEDNVYTYRRHDQSLSDTKAEQVREMVISLKRKYAESFFKKFHFSWLDRAKIWYHASKRNRPTQYVPYYFLRCLYKYLVQILVFPFFWNKSMNRKYRRILNSIVDEKYSFSEKK